MDETIRRRAFELWEAAGRPSGLDLDFWLAAEQLVALEDGTDEKLDATDGAQEISEAQLSETDVPPAPTAAVPPRPSRTGGARRA